MIVRVEAEQEEVELFEEIAAGRAQDRADARLDLVAVAMATSATWITLSPGFDVRRLGDERFTSRHLV